MSSENNDLPIGCYLLILLGVIVFALCCIFFPGIKYSEGERTGVVYKISEKGFINNTYEGELSLQMAQGAISNDKFNFSVKDKDTFKKVQEAAKSGKRVTLSYIQKKGRGSIYADTEYDVIDVITETTKDESKKEVK